MQIYVGIMRTERADDVKIYAAANNVLEAKGVMLDEALGWRAFDIQVKAITKLGYETEEPCLVEMDPDHITNVVPEYLR